MGNAFLFKKAGQLRKHRERRKWQLGQHLVPVVHEWDIFAAKCWGVVELIEGSFVEICIDENNTISILNNRNKIGFIPKDNPRLKRQIYRAGGSISGELVKKRQHSGILEIAVIKETNRNTHENSKPTSTTR